MHAYITCSQSPRPSRQYISGGFVEVLLHRGNLQITVFRLAKPLQSSTLTLNCELSRDPVEILFLLMIPLHIDNTLPRTLNIADDIDAVTMNIDPASVLKARRIAAY